MNFTMVGGRNAPFVLFAAFAIALALLAANSVIDYRNSRELEGSSGKVSRTLEALEKLRQIGNTFYLAESSQRGYLLTSDDGYLGTYREMQRRTPLRLSEVGALVSDTPVQRQGVERLRALAGERFGQMDGTLDVYRNSGPAAAMVIVRNNDGMKTMESVREQIRVMLEEESRILAEQRVTASSAYSRGLAKALASTAIVALALTAFYLLMHRYLRERDEALKAVEASNAELEQRVIDRTTELSHLSRHLLNVREHEKKVIARDLHDDFGSYLTAINMDVSRTRDKIATTNPEQAAKLERTLGLLNSAIEMKRQLISELRPSILDNLGLGAALEQYIDEWSRRTGITATFDHHGELVCNDDGCLIAIFRVFQEALTNIAKHAHASRVSAHAFRVDETIDFEIADDGVGLSDADRAKPGVHGLLGIRERVLAYGGHLEIVPGRKRGTVVRARMPCVLPLDDKDPAHYVLQFA